MQCKNHKTLILQTKSLKTSSFEDPPSVSSRVVINTRKEFLKMAKNWWDSRETNFNDFDNFNAISQPDN